MEGIGGRVKRFARLLTEVSGTLTICAFIDTSYEGVNSDTYHERVKTSTKIHYEQAKSMLVEYETLFTRIQQNMNHHLDLLTVKNSKNRIHDWNALIDQILPDEPSDQDKALDIGLNDMFLQEIENARFQERFRTIPPLEEQAYTRYRTGSTSPAPASAAATPTTAPASSSQAATTDPTAASSTKEGEETNSNKAKKATGFFGYNLMHMFQPQPSQSIKQVHGGMEELLAVLDCIAEKQSKLNSLNAQFDHNFQLLMKDVDTLIQGRMTPNEAANEEFLKTLLKLITTALFLTFTKRFLFPGTALEYLTMIPSSVGSSKKGLAVLSTFIAMLFIPGNVRLQSDLGNWLVTRPFTTRIIDWIKDKEEDEADDDEEMEEEAERLITMLSEEAPTLHRWLGTTATDPFRIERMIIYDFIQPLTDMTIFYVFLWKSLLSFMPRIPAHLVTMLSYAIYRDTIEEPHRAFLKLPSVESFVHSCMTSGLLQLHYLASGTIIFPMLSLMFASVEATLTEMSSSTAYHKESWQLYNYFIEIQAMKEFVSFKAFETTMKKLRQEEIAPMGSSGDAGGLGADASMMVDNALVSVLSSKVKIPSSYQANGQLQSEYKTTARNILEIFSTDYFADHSSRRLNKEDIVDFMVAFEQYRQQCIKRSSLSVEELKKFDKPIFGEKEEVIVRFLTHPSTLDPKALAAASSTAASASSSGSSNSTESSRKDRFWEKACHIVNHDIKRGEEITYMKDLEQQLAYMVIVEKLFPKGASIAEFEDFFAYVVTKLPKPEKVDLQELQQSLGYWENVTIDEFLDFMQSFYMKLLESGKQNVALFEPELYAKFEQQLAGRRPVTGEVNHLFAKFQFYLQIGAERIKNHELHSHGLTQHRMSQLLRKYSTQSPEVEILKKEWEDYFVSVKHRKKVIEAIPNIEKKRMLYELLFTRRLRQHNPLAMKKSTTSNDSDGQGSDGDGGNEGSSSDGNNGTSGGAGASSGNEGTDGKDKK